LRIPWVLLIFHILQRDHGSNQKDHAEQADSFRAQNHLPTELAMMHTPSV
jgi:hypothetical protein